MSLVWVVVGSFMQMVLALFLFMMAAFAGGGVVSGRNLPKWQIAILDLSIYLLPALCLISAGVVIFKYLNGGSNAAFWWYLLPIVASVIHLTFTTKI